MTNVTLNEPPSKLKYANNLHFNELERQRIICVTHFKMYGWQTIALIMSRRFSESPPAEFTSCGTQALASSHSPCCRHLLKYSNRSWREVSASQPKGCMVAFIVTLLCSVLTTGEHLYDHVAKEEDELSSPGTDINSTDIGFT